MKNGKDESPAWRFVKATLPWLVGVCVLWVATHVVFSSVSVRILHALVFTFGLVLAFSAFAGGSSVSAQIGKRGPFLTFLSLAGVYGVATFGDLAYLAPTIDHWQAEAGQLQERFPFGPEVPRVLAQLRDTVASSPSENRFFGSIVALESSAQYFEKRIQFPRVMGVIAILMACLGASVGILTQGLRSGVRYRVRWLIGLVLSLLVLLSDNLVEELLKGSQAASAAIWSWAALSFHLSLLILVAPLAWRRARG